MLILEQGHRNSWTTPNCHECLYPHRDRLTQGCWLWSGLPLPGAKPPRSARGCIRMNPGTPGESQGSWPCTGLLSAWPGLRVLVNTLSIPFQCVGPRRLTRRGGAEPSAPGTSTGATPSAPSRRARSLASAPGSESSARATSRRRDSATTSWARGRLHPWPCLAGGSRTSHPTSASAVCLGGGPRLGRRAPGIQSGSASDLL